MRVEKESQYVVLRKRRNDVPVAPMQQSCSAAAPEEFMPELGPPIDHVDDPPSARRSALMSRIRTRDTKPEKLVRSVLHRAGFRFRLHRRDLPGSPDLVLPARRLAIFVHGCFWHRHAGCSRGALPRTRRLFWDEKLSRNVERDRRATMRLVELGWNVLVVWGCEVAQPGILVARLAEVLPREPLERALAPLSARKKGGRPGAKRGTR